MEVLCLVLSVWAEVLLIIAHFGPDQTQSKPAATHHTARQSEPPACVGLHVLTAGEVTTPNMLLNTLSYMFM